ncbi:SGNH/GDSL hydrolase family protein [Nonomuraea sp. NEAU-A123]|uniref:SGNH/GDSL hydrolase family protein n=1 Tax=Nonomuraea sp. NEAU-A123 TaxID=2839649 RepID=UPI001BE4449E|nr:SGNH/GDSL hydrolase family protein [Nonomuraea sp. NEAU-A123]MBT2231778.1 SGNH/GDSL hydrolase family protein [Nonomuraea sp. NEAU-A123]
MGDSYGSGTGAGDYEPGTTGSCFRSANSYSSVIVDELRQRGKRVKFTNVTCSGSAIRTLRESFKGEPPQFDALKRDTKVVMLSIGTGDIDFAGFGGLCIQADCSGAPATAIKGLLPGMGENLKTLLIDIKARSPRAKIVLTGYGQQVTPSENAEGVPLDPICDSQVFSAQERVDGNQVARELDATLRNAAKAAKARGVNVLFASPYVNSVDLRPEFEGHSLCQSEPPFYRGFDALAPGQEGIDAVLHLNQQGQAAMADLIQRRIPVLATPASL